MSNGDGLIQQLLTVGGVQVSSSQIVSVIDAGISAVAKLVPPLGTAAGLIEGIVNLVDPPSNAPSIQDLQNQISAFAATVEQQLNELQATVAGGLVKYDALTIEQLLTGPNGPLSIAGEIPGWQTSPGLPLPASINPKQYQIFARSALATLLGSGSPLASPPVSPPTPVWWLPVGDLPLFNPQNPWTYTGTTKMFNEPDPTYAEGLYIGDANDVTDEWHPQWDLSAFHFTNNFSPTNVAGIPSNDAFNPTWVLPQSMAAVYCYLLIWVPRWRIFQTMVRQFLISLATTISLAT